MRQLNLILTLFVMGCGITPADKLAEPINYVSFKSDSVDATKSIESDSLKSDSDFEELDYASYYIVVADTGKDNSSLLKKMTDFGLRLGIPIDSMGRFFDENVNLIKLPDNDEDEIYAGDYFPRRFPSETLSIEYISFYRKDAGEKTMALIAGIYEDEYLADTAFNRLSKVDSAAFKIKSDVYIGCMH